MKANKLSEILGLIDSDLIDEAGKDYTTVKWKRPGRRGAFAILAAVLLLAGTFTVAFAANADFRAAVISFFHIGTAETVPQGEHPAASPANDITVVSTANIEGLVNIDYLKLGSAYEYSDGVVFTYDESAGRSQGSYWRVDGDKLIALRTKRVETTVECRGKKWSVRFDWSVVDGKLYIHSIQDSIADGEEMSAVPYALNNGDTQNVLLKLPFPFANLRSYSEYAVTMNLKTGKVTDFLTGCGLEKLTDLVHSISFSDDMSKAIVTMYDSVSYNGYYGCYYLDIAAKKLVRMHDFIGEDFFADGEPYCWLLDNNTLFYVAANRSAGRRFNLKTGEKSTVYTGVELYSDATGGVQFLGDEHLGGRYALNISADRTASLIDLLTGTQTPIDGFTFTKLTGAYINAEQTKIYFMRYNDDDLRIGNLGVLDILDSKLFLLDREGEAVRLEYNLQWFDNNRIAVSADKAADKYLYLYEFKSRD